MRTVLACVAIGLVCVLLTGCATAFPVGSLFTELKLPIDATANGTDAPKVGTAQCTSVLGLVATGDASIETAKKNGGITKVHHVDWEAKNILGIYGEYKVIVYGE